MEVAAAEAAHEELFQISCGKDFWCAVFSPKCKRNKSVPPCRDYCKGKIILSRCLYKITHFTYSFINAYLY